MDICESEIKVELVKILVQESSQKSFLHILFFCVGEAHNKSAAEKFVGLWESRGPKEFY